MKRHIGVAISVVGMFWTGEAASAARYSQGSDAQLIFAMLEGFARAREEDRAEADGKAKRQSQSLPALAEPPKVCAGDKTLAALNSAIAQFESLKVAELKPHEIEEIEAAHGYKYQARKTTLPSSISFRSFLQGFLTPKQMDRLPQAQLVQLENRWKLEDRAGQLDIMLDYSRYVKTHYEFNYCATSYRPPLHFNFFSSATANYLIKTFPSREDSQRALLDSVNLRKDVRPINPHRINGEFIQRIAPSKTTQPPYEDRPYPSEVSGE